MYQYVITNVVYCDERYVKTMALQRAYHFLLSRLGEASRTLIFLVLKVTPFLRILIFT